MQFTAIWFRSEEILSRESAETFFLARDLARSRLATHRVRSGATHAEVRSDEGVLFFDSRVDAPPPAGKRSSLASGLVKRFTLQKSLGNV